MSTLNTSLPISFYLYRKDGTPNPDIRRAFLQRITLFAEDAIKGKYFLEDKSEWTLVLEPAVREALLHSASVECVTSFQVRTQGAYAVARIWNPPQRGKSIISSNEEDKEAS